MITYSSATEELRETDLDGFLAHWDFNPPSGTLLEMIHRSAEVVIARDAEANQVCGYVTALCDGIAFAFVSALEVRPEYRRNGIGTELMRQIVARLDVFGIYLSCAPAVMPFYESLGFKSGVAMSKRK